MESDEGMFQSDPRMLSDLGFCVSKPMPSHDFGRPAFRTSTPPTFFLPHLADKQTPSTAAETQCILYLAVGSLREIHHAEFSGIGPAVRISRRRSMHP